MNSGIIYLYKDESKNSVKITDFDVKKFHLSFRENLFKSWAASLMAEIVIKTKAAGSPEQIWRIANGFLDGMELCDERESRLGLVRFLWRYLEVLGVQPNTKNCCQCGISFLSGKFDDNALSYNEYTFDEQEHGFICSDCFPSVRQYPASRMFSLGKPSITYLEAVCTLTPKQVREIIIDEKSFTEMKELTYHLIEKACDSKLKTLESGIGIL